MRNKIQNIQDLEYSNNQILIGELIKKWLKAKPKNKEVFDDEAQKEFPIGAKIAY